MPEAIESAPVHITNISMPQAPAGVTEVADVGEAGESADAGASLGVTTDTGEAVQLTEEEQAAAEAKALEAQRAEEAKAKEAEERRAKMDRAKRIAEREAQRQAERAAQQREFRRVQMAQAQLQQQLAAERAAREQAEQFARQFQADPLAHMEKLGIKPEDIAKRAVEDNTAEAKLARLEAQLKEEREARQRFETERAQREEAARQAAAVENGRRDFIAKATNEDHYPYLALVASQDPHGVIAEAERILKQAHASEGVVYSDHEIREFMNQRYERLITLAEQKRGAGKSNAAPTAKTPETNLGTSTQAKTPAGKPQTLTNKANTRGTTPPSFDDLDDAEQRRVMAEQLRALRKSG